MEADKGEKQDFSNKIFGMNEQGLNDTGFSIDIDSLNSLLISQSVGLENSQKINVKIKSKTDFAIPDEAHLGITLYLYKDEKIIQSQSISYNDTDIFNEDEVTGVKVSSLAQNIDEDWKNIETGFDIDGSLDADKFSIAITPNMPAMPGENRHIIIDKMMVYGE